jgi:hypothetical protein
MGAAGIMTQLPRALHDCPVRVALLVVTALLANSASGSPALAESFDQPLQKKIVNLGPSTTLMPNHPAQIQLSCFYYSAFLVKELYDQGVKGAQGVTIEPILNGQIPPCRMLRGPKERFIDEEGRFFIGAKGSLLFLEESEAMKTQVRPFVS